MKTMKLFTTTFLATGFILMSCNEGKTKEVKINDSEVTAMSSSFNSNKTIDNTVTTREYAMNDGSEISYSLGNDGVESLEDWEAYNTLNNEISEVEAAELQTTNERIASWDGVIANLHNTIPDWLKTEEVMEDVADVQKEYKELVNEKNATAKEREENLEELSEQFDDLQEELTETVNEYLKNHADAIEEYNEEMRKGKEKAAVEEYNEEIKKNDKIADYEEQ